MIRSGLYNVLGALVRAVVTISVVPLLIASLGLEMFGLWSLVFAIINLVAMAEGGLSVVTTVFLSRDLAGNDASGVAETMTAATSATLAIATLLAALIWVGAPLSAGLFPTLEPAQASLVVASLGLSSLAVLPRLLQQVPVGVEQASRRYDILSILLTVQSLATNFGMLFVVWSGGGVVALVQWHIFVGFVMLAVHSAVAWGLLRRFQLRFAWNPTKSRAMLRFTGSTWLTMVGSTLFTQVDRVIVGALLGPRPLGIYAAITSLATQINIFSSLPVQPVLPEFGRAAVGEGAPADVERPLRQAVQINAAAALGIGGALLVLAPLLAPLLVPDAGAASTAPLQIATAIYALYSLNAVGYFVLLGLGAVLTCMGIVAAGGATALLLIALGGASFGLPGAVAGNVGYLLTLLLNPRARQRLSLPPGLWVRWLRFPLIWFVLMSVVGIAMPQELVLRVALLCVAIPVLAGWFVLQEREAFTLMAQRLGLRRE